MEFLTAKPTDTTAELKHYAEAKSPDSEIFFAREPRPSDLMDILECTKDAIDGVDYLPAYFHRYLQQPNRRNVVVVHKPSNKVVYFGSELMIDDERTCVSSSGRAHKDWRKLGLTIFGGVWLDRRSRPEFPNCSLMLGVTRHDDTVLAPRYFGRYQINRLLGTNHALNLSSNFNEMAKLAHAISSSSSSQVGNSKGKVSIIPIPYSATSKIVSPSDQIAKVLLGGEYVIIDSFPYKLSCDSNFSRYRDLFDTKVYVSSRNCDLSALSIASPQKNLLSAIDSVAFVNTNPVQSGLHFKFYVYTTSIDSLMALLHKALLDAIPEIRRLRQASDTTMFTNDTDRVQYTIVFPVLLKSQEVRSNVLKVGFQPGVTGVDIQRQYLFKDEMASANWHSHY